MKIVECPRDAWQAMPRQIPAEIKAEYLRAAIHAGFTHIDAVSFVSPAAVPQMADSEQVLTLLGPVAGADILGIVVNEKGAERAVRTGAVRSLGFPYSLSPTFLARNQKQSIGEARRTLDSIVRLAQAGGLAMVVYVSMAFGNPYGDAWRREDVVTTCQSLQQAGVEVISLADTVGMASPEEISSLVSTVIAEVPCMEVGAHLHARPDEAAAKVSAAYEAGCRRMDMAMGGQGGCPFAQDALVGNIATELGLSQLNSLGADMPDLHSLAELLAMSGRIADRFGSAA